MITQLKGRVSDDTGTSVKILMVGAPEGALERARALESGGGTMSLRFPF